MSKFRIVNLIDKVFVTVAIFLIIFAWINFYIKSLWVTFIFSLAFSFAIVYVLYYFLDYKTEKKNKIKANTDEINKNFLAFRLSSKAEKYKLIKKILDTNHETKLLNNKLTYQEQDELHLVIICTHIDNLTQNDLINLLDEYASSKIDEFDIICGSFNANINTKILKNKKINLIDKQNLYTNFFSKYETYPDDSIIENGATKLKFIDILKGMFLPSKAKGYFFCGLILIFSAIILPYHYYYLIFGSMLLLFAIICKLMKRYKH